MKLILSLTIIWALCSSAEALQCQTCSASNCSSTVSCRSQTMCATVALEVTTSGATDEIVSKSCASSSTCPFSGTRTTFLSVGDVSEVTSLRCCSTDNCNSETPSFPPLTTNNLQCFSCNLNGSKCGTKLQCRGAEDRCFKVMRRSGSEYIPMSGCISANLCPIFEENKGSCCATSLCNKATTSAVPKTTTTSTKSPKTTSDACSCRLSVLHLLGLLVFTLY